MAARWERRGGMEFRRSNGHMQALKGIKNRSKWKFSSQGCFLAWTQIKI